MQQKNREVAKGQKKRTDQKTPGRTESKTDKRGPPKQSWRPKSSQSRSQASECTEIFWAPEEQPVEVQAPDRVHRNNPGAQRAASAGPRPPSAPG